MACGFLLSALLEPVGELAADTFDDRGVGDERHFATYKWPIHSLTTNELQIRPMMLGDYLARRFRQMLSAEFESRPFHPVPPSELNHCFRQMASDELDVPEIRHLPSDESQTI